MLKRKRDKRTADQTCLFYNLLFNILILFLR
jgi:hypothetical protein